MASDRAQVNDLGTVGRAFFGRFQTLREVQRRSIAPILSGNNVLVTSATASGKTEAILAPLLKRTRTRARTTDRIRVLLIAPTRALVNDLAARVEIPLHRLGLTWGRQTGDLREKSRQPFLLITTPESFDSMLVRDGQTKAGIVVDHLLAGVLAVFVDEAHLFDGTARGDQLFWLLARLRRLRRLNIDQEETPGGLQVCAGSATVGNPVRLARDLLGAEAIALQVHGARKIEVFSPLDDPVWHSLDDVAFSWPTGAADASRMPLETATASEGNCSSGGIAGLRNRLEVVSHFLPESLGQRLWQAVSSDDNRVRKALVFVPSRQQCDILSNYLACALTQQRAIKVLAHHGSLSRVRREEAERTFAAAHDAVLVATTTLEVGVDIGDVDLVALVGAPPSTRSLLQRIGRGGRETDRTRVLALPQTLIDQAALASMLLSARDGDLEPAGYARRWSVFVQQVGSFVAQSGRRGRQRSDLLALVQDVWPDETTAMQIIDGLLENDRLTERMGRLTLGESWADLFDGGGPGMHTNFGSSGNAMPVVDANTGETIAHVARQASNRVLALGGQRWQAKNVNGEVLLTPKGVGRAADGFSYGARRGPTRLEYAIHARRGLGFDESDAPLVNLPSGPVWLHFGGSAYQTMLCALMPNLRPATSLVGLATIGYPGEETLGVLAERTDILRQAVQRHYEELEPALAPGRYQQDLPEVCRREVVTNLLDPSSFRLWLETRHIWEVGNGDPRWEHLQKALHHGA